MIPNALLWIGFFSFGVFVVYMFLLWLLASIVAACRKVGSTELTGRLRGR